MDNQNLAEKIYRMSNIKGEFLLRSGRTSREYFDKYLFESCPAILSSVAQAMAKMLPPGTEVLAGLEMGGIPVTTMLSHYTDIDCIFVRKKQKAYGTCKLAEGVNFDGRQVVVIEDVVTSGGQILESVAQLRDLGAHVKDVLCVIDREAGGKENLAAMELTLRPLFTIGALKAAAGV